MSASGPDSSPLPTSSAPVPGSGDPADRHAGTKLRLQAAGLTRAQLDPDPILQLQAWFADAEAADLVDPGAMALATVDDRGRPSVRFVLLRGLDERGLVFFTNHRSRKGRELLANPWAAVVLDWHVIGRQARVEGRAEPIAEAESDAYFAARSPGSQLGAWASPQSEVVADRAELDRLHAEQAARWAGRTVERPPHWGGFRVVPDEFEFWQQGRDRLHDRFRYRPGSSGTAARGPWIIERLAP